MIIEKTGNIFNSHCQTIVNTINTVGFMGKGIALEMQLRYPEMCDIYKILCGVEERYFESSQLVPTNRKPDEFSKEVYADLKQRYGRCPRIEIGKLWLYTNTGGKWILNFPTKIRWHNPSKIEYLEKGLEEFVKSYAQEGIESIAFPILGGSSGGIPENESLLTMRQYLDKCDDIEIEIWHYDRKASDELYIQFKETLREMNQDDLAAKMRKSGFSRVPTDKIYLAINNPDIYTVSQMMEVNGLGYQSIKKVYEFLQFINQSEAQ